MPLNQPRRSRDTTRVAARRRQRALVGGAVSKLGFIAFRCPFHPPGKPSQLRTQHLADFKSPTLICQGTRDAFGTREVVSNYELSERTEILWLEDGDHDLKPRKRVSGITAAEHLRTLAAAASAWADRIAH